MRSSRGKTAALDRLLLPAGRALCRAEPEVCETLTRYGHDLGMAFQIADDVLDSGGRSGHCRQIAGHRPVEAKGHAAADPLLATVGPPRVPELNTLLSRSDNHHRDALRPWFERYDAIAYAQRWPPSSREQARQRRIGLAAAHACLQFAVGTDRFRRQPAAMTGLLWRGFRT